MSLDWAEYLSIAESLCGTPVSGPPIGSEAQQRAGVSRASYAAFVSARNQLRDADTVSIPSSGNPHRFVASHYTDSAVPRRAQIGIELDRIRLPRNRCDYDDIINHLPALTRRSLAGAVQILAALRRL